jgi:hypothetical protein
MQDNGYRILKLKTGESLVCKLLVIKGKIATLERPMQFRSVMFMDQKTMKNTDVLVFKTWTEFAIDKVVDLTVDIILAILTPDERLIACYELEKNKEDDPEVNKEIEKLNINQLPDKVNNVELPPDNINVTFNIPPEMADEIFEMMAENGSWDDEEQPPKPKAKKKTPAPKNVKKSPNNKNFGNNPEDWSPDPSDYI